MRRRGVGFVVIALAMALSLALVGVATAAVPGWPTDRIAQGTIAVFGSEVPLLQRRPVHSLFTYAGIRGDGDRGVVIRHDKKIDQVMKILRGMEHTSGSTFMLTVVFYNVNASTNPATMRVDWSNEAPTRYLEKHIINYLSLLRQLESYKEPKRPVPATLILSPDFLGELHKGCQPRRCRVPWDTLVPLREALTNAFDELGLDQSEIPAEFLAERTEIKHYIKAINWMARRFAPSVPFGWHTNVWAGDPRGHGWLHLAAQKTPGLISERVQAETDFLRKLNVLGHSDPRFEPHFLAFDKYAVDVFDPELSGMGVNVGYLYSVKVWDTYLALAKGVSEAFSNKPIMLWQLPGGHLQVEDDIDDRGNHASTAPDYFLGNPKLADDLSNAAAYIRNTPMPKNTAAYQSPAQSVGEYLACPPDRARCWANGHLNQARAAYVFAILWGGGDTTAVVGLESVHDDRGWLFDRIKAHGLSNGEGVRAVLMPQYARPASSGKPVSDASQTRQTRTSPTSAQPRANARPK